MTRIIKQGNAGDEKKNQSFPPSIYQPEFLYVAVLFRYCRRDERVQICRGTIWMTFLNSGSWKVSMCNVLDNKNELGRDEKYLRERDVQIPGRY
jgi:hypothetical protein